MANTSKRIPTLSLIFGIISLGGGLILFLPGLIASLLHVLPSEIGADYLFGRFHSIYLSVFIFFAILGLLLGIIGRKSSKVGIILSTIALLVLLFWYFIYLGFSHMQ